ncbi:hypothetical protein GOP47_0021933 [Adiantum capillus-veneris]|uniref:Transmembrane protein 18 n=1 Tax=Adiantum capillus-veneris TaxID=13818 RepID=A0A9D4Z8B2_ADICA|nr:hypothetical protein GOP47_0021933 [Adiantum capillus-veneris]
MGAGLEHHYHALLHSFGSLLQRLRVYFLRSLSSTRFSNSFAGAVDWREPWLLSLGTIYLILILFAILTRKNNNLQMGLFIFTLSGVYFSERLNVLLSHNWTFLTKYPYFDHQGIFMSAVWSAPLLFIACIILVLVSTFRSSNVLTDAVWDPISTFLRKPLLMA